MRRPWHTGGCRTHKKNVVKILYALVYRCRLGHCVPIFNLFSGSVMDLVPMLCAAVLCTTAHMSAERVYVVFVNTQFSQNAQN
jgi:hypothetical protein